MNEVQQDLQTARQIIAASDKLYHKYRRSNIQHLARILTVATECNVPWIDLELSGGKVKMNKCPLGYRFYFDHEFDLVNTATNAQPEMAKWYIHFSGNAGPLNFTGSQYAYKPELNKVWKDFLKWIQSYDPIDWDDMNYEYVFSLENGLRLYHDFQTGYDKFYQEMNKAVCRYKMAELQAQIDALRGDV